MKRDFDEDEVGNVEDRDYEMKSVRYNATKNLIQMDGFTECRSNPMSLLCVPKPWLFP